MSARHFPVIEKDKLVLTMLFMNFVIMVMNTSMFTVAIPEIALDFNLSPALAAWMVTSYSVFFALGTLLYGRLTAFITMPVLLSVGLSLLGMGSLLGFLADNYLLLVLARVVQAAGTSVCAALGVVMISRYFPPASKSKALAMIAAASALGFGLGPLAGGLLSEYLGWRYLFAISLLGVATIPIYVKWVPRAKTGTKSFDVIGFLLFSTSILSVLIAVSTGILSFLIGLVCLPVFLYYIQRVQEPFLAPALLKDSFYQKALFLVFAVFFIHFTILFVTPLLLSELYGLGVAAIGWLIFIGALASTVVMRVLGRYVEQVGIIRIAGISISCMILASFFYAGFADRSIYWISLFFFLSSVGFSTISMSMSNLMTRYLPADGFTAGYGALQLIQFFGGALGVALAGAILEVSSQGAFHPLWLAEAGAYSNAYSVGFCLSLLACFIYLFFFRQAKQHVSD
ncbi:MFS transporter [Salsuginibacillus kocurii]|uniref:MFS transporter n=1 Tax=Salsuginibacillus kocurii TaxID=427078 RepID=UPI0003768C63|nr:MFS transporter [Salsuginibacillus kocurii]